MSAKAKKRTDASRAASPWKGLVLIAAAAAALTVGCFFLSALFLLRQDAPDGMLTPFAFLSVVLPALLAGFAAGKQMKRSGWLYGALCTLPEIVTLCALCVAMHGSAGKLLAAAVGVILVCGAVGGILGVNLRRKRKYR